MEHKIISAAKGSPAADSGIEAGDVLIAINGKKIADVLDYTRATAESRLELTVKDGRTGKVASIDIEKEEWEELGLTFENYLMDSQRRCRNRCVFCFEDQLPSYTRDSLKSKDDDWRLSFIMGNYVTLTTVDDAELERIVELKASPLYISVHAFGEKRVEMMRNPNASKLRSQLEFLAMSGISFHCQIVLCPGVNDGAVLNETLSVLSRLRPYALSVAVVPVGLTAHRDGLFPLRAVTRGEAERLIDTIDAARAKCLSDTKDPFVYASDELYVLAGRPIPEESYYGDFAQLENGVGLARKFETELEEALEEAPRGCAAGKTFTLITGVAAKPWLEMVAQKASSRTGAEISVVSVHNRFFGGHIDVAGLITAADIMAESPEIKGKALIPRCMLRAEGDVFLDDGTLEQLKDVLKCDIDVVDVDGWAFVDALTGQKGDY